MNSSTKQPWIRSGLRSRALVSWSNSISGEEAGCETEPSRTSPPNLNLFFEGFAAYFSMASSLAFSGLRRIRGLLRPTIFPLASSANSSYLLAASLCFFDSDPTWRVSLFLASDSVSLANLYSLLLLRSRSFILRSRVPEAEWHHLVICD
ncbi:hypothetical protein CRG98_013309 [Punica granatum]|uniref:Uncharacterized protein n=1 Tax=Punica granatum TaxID=22663 RepID=A0A2I0KDN3_PUNGR|nr:hypothetical protein CRG98_013309 [Punica granatum]